MATARQSTNPVQFRQSVRTDEGVLMTSGRAGKVLPVGYIPVLRGDSAAGRVSVDLNLAEMPRPLLNAVFANVQAWFVPKSIHPKFSGEDEFLASYAGETIKQLGAADRTPPAFFSDVPSATAQASEFFKTLGIHTGGRNINTDLVDAFNIIYNFRLAAHSTKLTRKKYYAEDPAEALALPRAFWPSGRFARVVPDYERNIVIGAFDLDVTAGRIPVEGLLRASNQNPTNVSPAATQMANANNNVSVGAASTGHHNLYVNTALPSGGRIWADFAAEGVTDITTSLADLDKARLLQSFAKLRQSMAGNNVNGFVNDDMILAHLMQGLSIPESAFKRPWLLDSKRVPFGFAERFSTTADALDQSVTTGRTGAQLSINLPTSQSGGVIIITVEVLPERLDERQADFWLHTTKVEELPDALRDILNPEPVDIVPNRRIDAAHTSPNALYGYEGMNDRWNRSFTRLGGIFHQPVPGAQITESRAGLWQANIINPVFTADHWLAPADFPHYVFADTQAPAFELVTRHSLKIVGNTQIGDVLAENNDEWALTAPQTGEA